MFARYVRWREECCAREDEEFKLVEPYTPGLTLLGIDELASPPLESLKKYVATHREGSVRFFDPETPSAAGQLRSQVLTFSSPLRTEDESNNSVYCRLFERPGNKRAVVLLPHWNAAASSLHRFGQCLARGGVTALQVSLPYHDERRPANELLATKMVSANLGRTIRSSRQAVLDARQAISWLQERGYARIGILGISLGSSISSIVAAHDQRVRAAALMLMADDFAEVVWTGRATRHIRNAFEGHLTLTELREIWSIISPSRYVDRPRENPIPTIVIAGKEDAVFHRELTDRIVQAYRNRGVPLGFKTLPCGHYTLASLPFSAVAFAFVLAFLRRNL